MTESGFDALTGAHSRQSLLEELDAAIDTARGRGVSLCVVYTDIANFKRFNGHNGHSRGDQLLVSLVSMLQRVFGTRSAIYRAAGDEFVAVLQDSNANYAAELAREVSDRFHTNLIPEQPQHCGEPECMGPAPLSIRIGVTAWEPWMNVDNLLCAAEERVNGDAARPDCIEF